MARAQPQCFHTESQPHSCKWLGNYRRNRLPRCEQQHEQQQVGQTAGTSCGSAQHSSLNKAATQRLGNLNGLRLRCEAAGWGELLGQLPKLPT